MIILGIHSLTGGGANAKIRGGKLYLGGDKYQIVKGGERFFKGAMLPPPFKLHSKV